MPPERELTREAAYRLTPGLPRERWPEVSRVVDAVLELPIDERSAFVAQACAHDAELRVQVEGLLDACARVERTGAFLGEPLGAFNVPMIVQLATDPEGAEAAVRAALAAALAGRYTIDSELGRGGMATVYLARDERHQRPVAIKVLDLGLARELGTEQFLREIRRTAQLHHPHIVQLLDSGDAEGLLFYVMPHMEGGTLRQRLSRERQLPVADVVAVGCQIAQALDHAHRHGLIHRDVKPENILFTEGQSCLADFGIARAMERAAGESSTLRGVLRGTIAYMSPEQAAGNSEYDGRSDVFSLGCVLYEALAGVPAYIGPTPEAVLAQRFTHSPRDLRVFRPMVPAALEAVVAKALALVPADRFWSAAEMARALGALQIPSAADLLALPSAGRAELGWDPIRGKGAGAWTSRARAALGRRRSRFLSAALPGLILGGGVLWAATRGAPKTDPHERSSDAPTAGEVKDVLDTSRFVILPLEGSESAAPLDGIAELLRKALQRWTGITVVDALELPEPLATRLRRTFGSADAQAAARALKAGRFLRTWVSHSGDSMTIRATLFDTRSGSRLTEETVRVHANLTRTDSALRALAGGVLFPGEVSLTRAEASAGTWSRPARQAYMAGHAALAQWDLAVANARFFAATEYDPQYTQAFLWLAQVRTWMGDPPPRWGFAAERAAVGRDRLAPREQLLADALLALARGELSRACPLWARLTALSPTDFTAWYGRGHCLRKDDVVVRDERSPSGWRFRTSYRAVLESYQHAFRLLPSIHRSFRGGSFDDGKRLLMTFRNSLRRGRAVPPDTMRFLAYPSWDGDTLAFVPLPEEQFAAANSLTRPASGDAAILHQREQFHDIATMWRSAFPQSADAAEAVAVSLDLLGNASAYDTLRLARRLATEPDDRLRMGVLEVWMRVKFSTPSESLGLRGAYRLADSLLRVPRPSNDEDARLLASLAALLGRANLAASYTRLAEARSAPPGIAQTAPALLAFAALGGPLDSIRALEAQVERTIRSSFVGPGRETARSDWLLRAAFLAVPVYQFESIPRAGQSSSVRLNLLAAWRAHDVTQGRRILATLSDARRQASVRPSDVMMDGVYPEAAILAALGDHSGALGWLMPTLDSLALTETQALIDVARAGPLVRAMALRAELAHRAGDRREARRWASAVLTLWSRPDDFARPTVQRMQALAR
jgi:eukaryotic-like serine/threonine-protein kinase